MSTTSFVSPTAGLSLASKRALKALSVALCGVLGFGAFFAVAGEPAPASRHRELPGESDHAAVKAAGSPRLDRFGDPLPEGAIARLGTVRLRHGDYLHSLGFTSDSQSLVSAGCDGVRVWETATGRPLRHFAAGVLPWSIALSGDGRRVALSRHHAGIGGPVEVWDTSTGKLIHKHGDRHYSLVRFSADGKRIAALTGNAYPGHAILPWQIVVWDASGRRLHEWNGPNEYIADMRFSADGKTLLLGGSDKAISIRDADSGKEVRRLRNLPVDVHTLALSPRGDKAAFLEFWMKKWDSGQINWGTGNRVLLIDLRTGAELRRWTPPADCDKNGVPQNVLTGLAWSPDGKRLAACRMDGPVRVWDVSTGEEVSFLSEGQAHSGGLTFSPNGRTLAVSDSGRTIRLLDAESGAERIRVTGHRSAVSALAVAADGRTAFTGTDRGMIHRWDVPKEREIGRLGGHKNRIASLVLSAEGRTLYSASHDGTLRAWDVNDGTERRLVEDVSLSFKRLTLSPDGKMLAVPVGEKELHLFDTATGKRLRRLTTKTRAIAVAFAADDPVVLVLTGDRTIWRWRTTTGKRLSDLSLPPDQEEPPLGNPDNIPHGEMLVLSPDGRWAAHASENTFLRVLDVNERRSICRLAKLPANVSESAFAPDGRTLAWAEESGVIHWLELATGRERRLLPGHGGSIQQLVFTADGKRIFSTSDDTTVLVWDLVGTEKRTLSAAQRDACWKDLADKDAAKAYRALTQLIAAPTEALALLRTQLKPAVGVDEKSIARRIADLDDDAFAVREQATEQLRKWGELTEPALRRTLESKPTLEMRRRIQGILDEVADRRAHPSPEQLRQLRAVEVLERIGTPEARTLLESLAKGAAGARLTREAKDTLRRLQAHRIAAP